MYDYNSISYEARERGRSRRHEAERERIARGANGRSALRSRLAEALQYLRHIPRGHLAGESR